MKATTAVAEAATAARAPQQVALCRKLFLLLFQSRSKPQAAATANAGSTGNRNRICTQKANLHDLKSPYHVGGSNMVRIPTSASF